MFPKKVKFRKWQTSRKHPERQGFASRGTSVDFGAYGVKTIDHERLTSRQLEAARKVLSRNVGKLGKVWIRVFPDMPFTKKPAEVKLGKGKGDPEGYCAPVEPGRVIFEVDGITEEVAREALRKASTKLPVRTKFVSR
ncbi:MAG: 50S ribosomal protein L16 [Candidatus Paceibacterota bacterium]